MDADHDGHERFWAVAADTTADDPSSTTVDEYSPRGGAQRRDPGNRIDHQHRRGPRATRVGTGPQLEGAMSEPAVAGGLEFRSRVGFG